MVTIYDIARDTGFSPPTVSKALNDRFDVSPATKTAIRASAEKLGYVVNAGAKMLITKKSYLIGLVYEEDELGLGIEHPLFSGIINSFKSRIEAEGYELIFLTRNLGNRRQSLRDHCRYRGVEAVLIVNCASNDADILDLIGGSVPCVSCNIVLPSLNCVTSENETSSLQAVNHLFTLGHRHIAHIAGPADGPQCAGNERLSAFIRGITALGLPGERFERASRWTADE
jgi:LacI family transcriptional regulator